MVEVSILINVLPILMNTHQICKHIDMIFSKNKIFISERVQLFSMNNPFSEMCI